MIYQTHVSDKQTPARPVAAFTPRAVRRNVSMSLAGERPVVVEIGDDLFHERLRKRDGALLVAEVIVEDRQRQLLRAFALVGPFEAELVKRLTS